MSIAVLLQLPGPFDASAPDGLTAINQLHDKIAGLSWALFGLAAVISGAALLLGLMHSDSMNPVQLFLRIAFVAILLVGFRFFFYTIAGLGIELGYQILSQADQQALNQAIQSAAPQPGGGQSSSAIGWIVGAVNFALNFSFNSGVGITMLIIALADVLFFVSVILMGLLYLALMIIHFVLGPVIIALGVIPGFGDRLLSSWFGSLVQLSFWPVWLAVVAWLIKFGNLLFLGNATGSLLSNDAANQSFLSGCLALLLALMNFATPFIVAMMFPVSRTGQLAQFAFTMGSARLSSLAGAGMRAGGEVAGGVVGGPAGAAAGGAAGGTGADASQKIANPVSSGGESEAA